MSEHSTKATSEAKQPKYFFVTGLPRSRTAWLANFLTCGDAFCFHDGLKYCRELEDLKKVFKRTSTSYVGNSDSALVLFYHELRDMFPGSKWLLVYRNFKECADSAIRLSFAGEETENILVDGAARLAAIRIAELELRNPNILIVDYETLDEPETVEAIVNHLTPDIEFDRERFNLLDTLNVQIHEAKYLVSVAEGIASIPDD